MPTHIAGDGEIQLLCCAHNPVVAAIRLALSVIEGFAPLLHRQKSTADVLGLRLCSNAAG